MEPSGYNVTDLIPQRPPMVMIDKLVYADQKTGKGILLITRHNPFCIDGRLTEAGMMEFIAQTAAAFTGYSRIEGKKEPSKGYIGSVKNLTVFSLPPEGCEIHSEISLDNELLGFTIITGKITRDNMLLAQCEMRILLENDADTVK